METSAKLYSLNYSNVKTLHFHNYAILYLMVVLPCCPFIFSR